MPLDTLSIDVTSTNEGRTQIFVLHGSLDLATSPSLRAALLDATQRDGGQVVVDLTQLEFLDSTGLSALIGAHKRALENDSSLRLVVKEGQILRLLRITGLLEVLVVYRGLDDALAGAGRLAGL
jgi:anti-sigma B factor antagonist